MTDDTVRTETEPPVIRDDGPQHSEDHDAVPTYTPCAVEFAAGAD